MAPKNKRHSAPRPRPPAVAADLRGRLEAARLDLLALLRALDELHVAQQLPEELQGLFDLDADCAEALWALDQEAGTLDFVAMTRDTLASLAAIPSARHELMSILPKAQQRRVTERAAAVRARLLPDEAYNQIPGRDRAVDQ